MAEPPVTDRLPQGHPPEPGAPGVPARPEPARPKAGVPGGPEAGVPGGPEAGVPGGPDAAPALRASDAERDAAVERLKTGLVEGRLTDEEFDQRMRAALTARTRADLQRLLADLPATPAGGRSAVPARPAERLLLSFKGHTQRGGRWLVPERCATVAYKGDYQLDLRAAELSAPLTAITVVAYKGAVDILVPPGLRVEMRGMTYGGRWVADVPDQELPPDAPVLRLRGVAYKGQVQARTLHAPRELPPP